ncbi:glycosyltransferase family 4 protein [Nonlabens sp. Asnod2-A12]|uniref:glycosyltransferase family 4 protein n=1 Tax=Nonlabens sp. Asnod2-A12 TaxID=3160578 RepID=UPI0038649DD2
MDKNKKVLIIGPFPNPITGLNLANLTVKHLLEKSNHSVRTIDMEINRELDNSIGKWKWYKLKIFIIYLEIYKIFNSHVIYCTIGQSFLGVIKYAPFVIMASLLRKKKIVHLHGNALKENYAQFSKFKKALARFTLQRFDKAIVLSKSLKHNFIPFLSAEKIVTLHNFISLEPHSYKKETLNKDSNILFLSNLLPAKGIIPFLEAVEIVSKKHSINVAVAGIPSQDHPEIMEMMERLKFVTYYGKVNGAEKANLFQQADIFCLPTLNEHEGQPLAILEAFASDCYVIASDVPGISDIFSDKNGDLLWPVTSYDLSLLMESAILNKEKVDSVKKYNKNMAKNFTIKEFGEKLLPIICHDEFK